MIEPEVLADRLQELVSLLRSSGGVTWARTKGELTWARVEDWETVHPPAFREPLSDEQDEQERASRTQVDEEERKGDAAASRYNPELKALLKRYVPDTARLKTIVSICCPPNPRDLQSMDKTQAQVESDGFCGLCWRHADELVESAKGRYRGRCNWCGEKKALLGQDPPKFLVVKHHMTGPGSIITPADMEKARKAS